METDAEQHPLDAAVCRIAAEVLRMAPERIGPDSRLSSLDATDVEVLLIYERVAAYLNQPLLPILESRPFYIAKVSDQTMWSLRAWATFSPKAAALLADYTFRPVDDTIDSITQSAHEGTFEDSGYRLDPLHKPLSIVRNLAWVLVPAVVLLLLVPFAAGYLEVQRCHCLNGYRLFAASFERGFQNDHLVWLMRIAFGVALASHIVPGWLALRRSDVARSRRMGN